MPSSPLNTIVTLIKARKAKDFDTAFACYAPGATVVLEKGHTGFGEPSIRAFIAGASALAISFNNHEIVETGDVALHTSHYVLDLEAQGKVPGRTADVLVRDANGQWLIAIDNPWVD